MFSSINRLSLSGLVEYITVVLLIGVGWAVYRIPQRHQAHRILAAFIGLVAFGFFIEPLAQGGFLPHGIAGFFAILQGFAGMIDPMLLLAYSLMRWRASQPNHVPLNPWHYVVPFFFLLFAWIVHLGIGLSRPNITPVPLNIVLDLLFQVYINGAYLAAFFLLLDAFANERESHASSYLRVTAWATGLVALTRIVSFVWGIYTSFAQKHGISSGSVVFLAMVASSSLGLLVFLLTAHAGIRGWSGRVLREVAFPLAASLLAFTFFIAVFWSPVDGLFAFVPEAPAPTLYFSQRWIFFSLILGLGTLRQHFFHPHYVRQAVALLIAIPLALFVGLSSEAPFGCQSAACPLSLFLASLPPLFVGSQFAASHLLPRSFMGSNPHEQLRKVYEVALSRAMRKTSWSSEDRGRMEALRIACGVFEKT